jgi:hypothetical protein
MLIVLEYCLFGVSHGGCCSGAACYANDTLSVVYSTRLLVYTAAHSIERSAEDLMVVQQVVLLHTYVPQIYTCHQPL